MTPRQILLIDDHALFRSGLRMIIESEFAEVEIVEVDSIEQVVHQEWPRPDLVLLDVRLQGLNGLESIALLHRRWPAVPIIMLSSDASGSTVRQAYERGAVGFVSKADSSTAVVAAIRSVFAQPQAAGAGAERPPGVAALTPRQCEVLNFLSQGLSNKSIAKKLDLSENTVRGHVQSLLTTLNATSRLEAVFIARRHGLID